jgi:hypothetical protein
MLMEEKKILEASCSLKNIRMAEFYSSGISNLHLLEDIVSLTFLVLVDEVVEVVAGVNGVLSGGRADHKFEEKDKEENLSAF